MSTSQNVVFAVEPRITLDEFTALLRASTLSQRRPINEAARLQRMLDNSNLLVTARRSHDNALVGLARCITDFGFACYVGDLAVSASAQGHGIGKELMERIREVVGPEVSIHLISAPASAGFYERIGMARISQPTFWFPKER